MTSGKDRRGKDRSRYEYVTCMSLQNTENGDFHGEPESLKPAGTGQELKRSEIVLLNPKQHHIPKLPNHTTLRHDRKRGGGGGLITLVHKLIPFTNTTTELIAALPINPTNTLEIQATCTCLHKQDLYFINLYIPHSLLGRAETFCFRKFNTLDCNSLICCCFGPMEKTLEAFSLMQMHSPIR